MSSLDMLSQEYQLIVQRLIKNNITVATMESCTSGCIASLLTDTEGSSAVFKGSFVSYCNEAKVRAGVPAEVIEDYGVYSPQTACAMAQTCQNGFGVDLGIGVTGSFGNIDPENNDSIPGEIDFALAFQGKGIKAFHVTLPLETITGRHKQKLLIAHEVAKRVNEFVFGE